MSEEPQKELEILWTPQQVAKYLGLNQVTIYRWIADKRMLDPTKIIRFSNRVRIPRSEVERIAGVVRAKLQDDSGL
jgi:excisionase family DNA binding protein